MALHQRLQQIWYGDAPGAALLTPLAWVYGLVTGLRRWLYRSGLFRTEDPGVPVVVVGNVTVGGTGKTPLVIWLVEQLAARGLRPGVVSRGYKGRGLSGAYLVTTWDPAERVGDEPCLICQRTDVPVVLASRRIAAARRLAELGVDVIISDDGLQHYALARNMEIAVVDGLRGLGNGRLLPAGPLREPPARLHSVDCVVKNGGQAAAGEVSMRLEGAEIRNLADGSRRPLAQARGETWHAVAGIGNPERFFRMLVEEGISILRHPRADHAPLHPSDLQFDDEHPILMTEKDAVKCQPFATARHWCLPVDAALEPAAAARLLRLLDQRCGLSILKEKH